MQPPNENIQTHKPRTCMIPTCEGNLGKFSFLPSVLVVPLRKWEAWMRWTISAWPPTTLALHGWGESPRLYKRLCLRMMESIARGWPQITFYESTKSDIVPGRTAAQCPGSTGDLDLINAIASCTVSFRLTLYGSHHRIVFVCADRR